MAIHMRTWSGTARRLFLAFAALIAIFSMASLVAVAGLTEIHGGLHRTRVQAEGVRVALELASAVRDQYAHQAHTIIIGNDSHLAFYSQAERRVLELTAQVRLHASHPDEQAWVDDIEKATAELDAIFRQRIVPAVLRGERADVQAEHARAQLVVSRIQERTDRLVEDFERAIGGLQEHVNAVEHRTFRWSLAFLLGAPLLAVAVGVSVGRSVARPMARLHEGAERLAGGNMDTRIEIDSPDEFGALARQFNAMTASLKAHQERLVQTEKLAGIGRLAAGIAHEINNPLGVILGYTRLLRKKAQGSLAEDLGVIEEETLRCKEIVEGLLDLSRPERLSTRAVDVRELCAEVVGRLADARQIESVDVTVDGTGVVDGDAPKLRQILFNLVRNAIEAAGPGGRVAIRVAGDEAGVEVEVVDSGPGLAPGVHERLFEPFFTTKPRGTGLGLAVSQAFARAHGGEITVGDDPGGGARFSVHLPRSR
jgi:two-component system NtrC family sensor kinase